MLATDCGCGFDPDSQCAALSQRWYQVCSEQTTDDQRRWMGGLPGWIQFSLASVKFCVVHGSPASINEFIFASTAAEHKQALLDITEADVVIGGHSVTRESDPVRRLVGVCPQELALYPELSATDNLMFFGRMAGLSRREARNEAARHLESVGLTERARDKVDKFSGGMKRRVNLAVALMSRPRLLFLDEPTVGIDPQSRSHIFDTVEGLRDDGMTVLYTTHYMEEADRLCNRLGIMDNGRLIRLGTPHELKAEIGDPEEVTLETVFLELTGRSLRD